MENKNNVVTLNNTQKSVAVRDIVLVANKTDEVGQPYLIAFAHPGDDFMCAIRVLPSRKTKNDLIIDSSYFNNPKTAGYSNGGYANVYTGINTIRRCNVTTWISSLDNDSYLRIIYSLFGGMLGYYSTSTNGKFHLPSSIPLNFNVNISLLGALRNSGITQKCGEIYVPPVQQAENKANVNKPAEKKDDKKEGDKKKPAKTEVQETTNPQSDWHEPAAFTFDPIVIGTIFSNEDENVLTFDSVNFKYYGMNPSDYGAIGKLGLEVTEQEFIAAISDQPVDLVYILTSNDKDGSKVSNKDIEDFRKMCKAVYDSTAQKIN